MYDIVLEKVLIYDGSGGKPYRGNLAVEDGRIAAIGDCSGPARRVIHGEGLAAAPGLIDVHTHNDNTLLWDRQMASALYQGVTTQVTGMCGLGLIPSLDTVRNFIPVAAAYEPDPAKTKAYAPYFTVFKRLYRDNRKSFRLLGGAEEN